MFVYKQAKLIALVFDFFNKQVRPKQKKIIHEQAREH